MPDHVTRHIVKAQNITKTQKECDAGCPERVTFRCHQCSLDLCSRCAHSHPRSQRFKDHTVVNATHVGPADVVIPVECPVHPGSATETYCLPCKTLVCAKCFRSRTSPHQAHTRESIEGGSARVHAELASLLIPRGEDDPLEPLLGAAIDKVKETRAALAAHLTKQLDKINAHEEATIIRVQADAAAKRDEITAAVDWAETALRAQEAALRQHGTLLRQMNDYTHALIAMVKGSELVEVGLAMKRYLEEARNLDAENVRPVVGQQRFPRFDERGDTTSTLTLGRTVEHPITLWTMKRKQTPEAVYVIGGWDGVRGASTIHRFDLLKQAWEVHLASMGTPRFAHAVTRIGSCLYILGGWTSTATATMLRIDVTKPDAQWMTCAPMLSYRVDLAAAVIHGVLYALAGRTSTVERYDPATDAWTACSPMRNIRSEHAAVALNDHIYVFGGVVSRDEKNTSVSDVDKYDPITDTWRTCAPMGTARRAGAAAVVNGSIIVAGGFAHHKPLASVERYNIASNTWTSCMSMPTARGHVAGCGVGTSLYVLGGSSTLGRTNALSVVERYDADTDRWEPCPQMPEELCGEAALAW